MYSDFSWKDAPLSSGSVPVITGALILDTDPFDFKFSQSDRHSVGSDPDFAMVSKYFLRRLNVVPLRNAANCVIFEVYQIVKRNGNSVIRVELILAVLQIGLRGKRRYAIVLARPSV